MTECTGVGTVGCLSCTTCRGNGWVEIHQAKRLFLVEDCPFCGGTGTQPGGDR